MFSNLAAYNKFLVALVTAIIVALNNILGWGDGETVFGMSVNDVVDVVVSITGAWVVRQVPNKPSA